MARDSSACRAGAGGFHATKKNIVNGVQVEVEVIPVGVKKPVNPAPGHLRGALARDPSVCLAAVGAFPVPGRKRTKRARNTGEAKAEVLPVDPAIDLLHKRMASELEALREILKKAELISRGSACKGGAAPAAGKSKRLLDAVPRVEAGGKAPPAKRRKVSPVPERKQMKVAWMSADEREQLAGRLASLPELPNHIVEFLQQQFGEDPHGEIEIDIHRVEDSVLFELKARMDMLDEERRRADAARPKEHHNNSSVMMEFDSKTQMDKDVAEETIAAAEQEEEDVDICGASDSDSSSSSSSDSDGSSSSSDSDSESDSDEGEDSPAASVVLPRKDAASAQAPPVPTPEAKVTRPCQPSSRPPRQAARSAEPEKVQDVGHRAAPNAVCAAGVIERAKLRRELLEMERAVLPDESIHAMDLRRLCIAEYGRPSVMRQLGLFLKADA